MCLIYYRNIDCLSLLRIKYHTLFQTGFHTLQSRQEWKENRKCASVKTFKTLIFILSIKRTIFFSTDDSLKYLPFPTIDQHKVPLKCSRHEFDTTDFFKFIHRISDERSIYYVYKENNNKLLAEYRSNFVSKFSERPPNVFVYDLSKLFYWRSCIYKVNQNIPYGI